MMSNHVLAAGIACVGAMVAQGAETLVFDQPEVAGMSGFRAHWDQPIPVTEDGVRGVKDAVVRDRGQTAVWGGETPGPLAFDAVHRSLLVRFPAIEEPIARTLSSGHRIRKVELVLPYLDEELWPQGSGGADYPGPDGYRYRMNWDCDKLYRAQRPRWHAVAHVLRQPWTASPAIGPTYNAAINGALYWKRFGAKDPDEDRFPRQLGPAEVSHSQPEGRMDVTAVLTDPAFGDTITARLRGLAACGFILSKWEVYDARFFQGAYEWAISTGPRAVLIRTPRLVVTFQPDPDAGPPRQPLPAAPDVAALAVLHKTDPVGRPTAVTPSPEAVAALNARFMEKPAWMPVWQYTHIRQLMGLQQDGRILPFYYRLLPPHVINRTREQHERATRADRATADLDYAVYLAWVDWNHGRPPRYWEGHLTAADATLLWYNFREALPEPVRDSIIRSWTAWLMPDRETEPDPGLRRQYDNTSGKLVHPMVDDPRVGRGKDGRQAEWNQGDTYYQRTGDWRGNKSFFRSGFTREMSTANFNSSATSGALLMGQVIASDHAMADGRDGLMQFPFRLWTHNAGVGQEFIDHYYWAIASAGNKLFADFCASPEDQMAGWSIIYKTASDLAGAWHPNLKKLLGPASRTYYEHVLGRQDGLYHILHVLSPQGALMDSDHGTVPWLSADPQKPVSAWGHDYPPATVALQSLSGPWGESWISRMMDDKPLPWFARHEKKVVAEGDWVSTYFGVNFGLSSIRHTPQRIHALGHWRRQARIPSSMREIGTLDVRLGINETRIAEDGEGLLNHAAEYRTYQHRNTMIMLAKPRAAFMEQKKDVIRSVQMTAALFNFEQPAPTWEIHVDDRRITSLPAAADFGQVVTVRDGVSYLAIRPLPPENPDEDAHIMLEVGIPQEPHLHKGVRITPALLVNAYLGNRDTALDAETRSRLPALQTGMLITMGDDAGYGSYAAFRSDIRQNRMERDKSTWIWRSGDDILTAGWNVFTVNGKDPYALLQEQQRWQESPLCQMGSGRLDNNGAVIERGARHPDRALLLHTDPGTRLYVAMNLLPDYLEYQFHTPDGVAIRADGTLSMGYWAIRGGRDISIKYHPFGPPYAPPVAGEAATLLFISGTAGQPQVTLNGADATRMLKPWTQDGTPGWLVPLTGGFPADTSIASRLAAAAMRREAQ